MMNNSSKKNCIKLKTSESPIIKVCSPNILKYNMIHLCYAPSSYPLKNPTLIPKFKLEKYLNI
jgi:hypothetical protein